LPDPAQPATEFEQHLKTANAEIVAALRKSSEIIAQDSAILEQIDRRRTADDDRELRAEITRNGRQCRAGCW